MLTGGIGFMVGTGGTALVSKNLGEGENELARKHFTMMVMFDVLLGLVITAIGIAVMKPVAVFFKATPEMMDDCVTYGRIMVAFTPAFMLQTLFHSFCVAAEKPNLGLAATVAAGLTNMALDALFIAVFKWGVTGAALATGIAEAVGAAIPFIYFTKRGRTQLWFVRTWIRWKVILKACANGASELLSSISSSIVGMAYNWQLMRFAGEDGVAAYGVLMYVNFIFIAMFIGYSVGSAPIVGFHYGAQNRAELRNMLKKSTVILLSAGVLMTALAEILAPMLAGIFVGNDEGLLAMTVNAFRIFSFSFLFAGLNIFISSFFTALNNGAVSAAVSFLRTLVFQLATVFLIPLVFGLRGIWIAIVASELLAFAVGLIFLFAKRKKYGYMDPVS
ncbi:MAG: polysaccharide biosynthesis C-terminal domain-containing protein, partial [Clostridia bacterium]|nr:polysaccharide biosynthesis C-terminal domain-containing protein [Clostridia bacterium]